jgi:hypothetical protein
LALYTRLDLPGASAPAYIWPRIIEKPSPLTISWHRTTTLEININPGDDEMLEDPGKDEKIKDNLSFKGTGIFTFRSHN